MQSSSSLPITPQVSSLVLLNLYSQHSQPVKLIHSFVYLLPAWSISSGAKAHLVF